MATTRIITADTGLASTLKVNLISNAGTIWDNIGLDLETYVAAQQTRYDIAVTETATGSGIYEYTVPATLPPGTYRERPRFTDSGFLAAREAFQWNGGVVTGAITGSGYLSISDVLQIMQSAARNAGINTTFNNDPYSLTDAHVAIQGAFRHFIRETKCSRQTDGVSLAEGSNVLDLSAIAAFHPERIIRVWSVAVDTDSTVRTPPITVTDYDGILRQRLCTVRTGAPCSVGFSSETDAITDTDADQAYTINFQWTTPLISWSPGDTGVGSTTINVPGDMADYVARTAAVCFLQSNQPAQQKEGLIARLWAQYAAYVESKRGTGNYGVRSVRRRSLSEIRRGY